MEIDIKWPQKTGLDIACFGLDVNGKLSDDRYFIFFNQKQSPEGALNCAELENGRASFEVDLARLPETVRRLTFVAAVDGGSHIGGNFGTRRDQPWIYLDKDDRRGSSNDGQNLPASTGA